MKKDTKLMKKTEYEDILDSFQISKDYYNTLLSILLKYPNFKEVKGLKSFEGTSGIYVIAIEQKGTFDVGYAEDIYRQIVGEWNCLTSQEVSKLFIQCRVFLLINCEQSEVLRGLREIIPQNLMVDSFLTEIHTTEESQRGEGKMDKIKDKLANINLNKKNCMVAGGVVASALGGIMILRKIFKGRGHSK